jgi:hypothetical protein
LSTKFFSLFISLVIVFCSWNNIYLQNLEISDEEKSYTLSNSNPIRNETISEIPFEVTQTYSGIWNYWDHHIDDWPIDDQEEIVYYIHIDNSLLGSTIYAFLDIYDAWLSAEPDLDLYLLDPDGVMVTASANEGDVSEEIEFVADMTGNWKILVHSYDGDGWFDLYRTVVSNSAPTIDYWTINTDNPFLNDNFLIDACGTFDPEDDTFSLEWSKDGSVMYNPNGTILDTCDMFSSLTDTNPHYFTITATDYYGAYSSESFMIQAINPGWGDGDGDSDQYLDLSLSGYFPFEQMTGIWEAPNVLSSDNLSIQIGMSHEIQIESTGGVSNIFTLDAPADYAPGLLGSLEAPHRLIVDSEVNGIDYQVGYKPSLIFNIWLDNEFHTLPIPMPTTTPMYEGQSSFSLAGFPLLYYWDDFAPLDIDYESGWLNYSIAETFTLAEVDLYPIIEWMIDNLASSLGQGWVGTATDILGWFIDIEVPLSFQVTVGSEGFQIVDVNSDCTCMTDQFKFNLIFPYESFSEGSVITNSAAIYDSSPLDGYSISSVVTLISYVSVEVFPNIVLGFEINGETLWEQSIYEFNSQDLQGYASWSSDDSSDFIWEWDEDLDGTPNNSDAFPRDATETMDSDADGVGDNSDAFPYDANENADFDSDGIGDNSDQDDDGDGMPDIDDDFPMDSSEQTDLDRDGIGDNSDQDDDGDGWLDVTEVICANAGGFGDPKNANVIPIDNETDVGPDGVYGTEDDTIVGDGLCNAIDPDDDNDGYNDPADPNNIQDGEDAFPWDPTETMDSDSDGLGDNSDAFPKDETETMDSDSDGVGDNSDAFPYDATEWEINDSNSENSTPGFTIILSIAMFCLGSIFLREKRD